jgi:CubicO group peptidase (beta-lactamase class C family)
MPPRLPRRALLALALPAPALAQAAAPLDAALAMAAGMANLRTLIVARDGAAVLERAYRGAALDRPANIKSASKTVLAMLAGIALERGVLGELDQPIGPVLGRAIPAEADPRVREITIRHLLSMRAGLERTSGSNYGRWVSSRDWLRFALTRPMEDAPGGRMIYSTGTSHILGAVLARASGRTLHQVAREWLGAPLGIAIPDWPRAPEGLHFGGNEMLMSPRALLAFGEACRRAGLGVIPAAFLQAAWTPQARSDWSGQLYGLGWWIGEAQGQRVVFAWGFGGQMLYLVPGLALTVVMMANPDVPRVPGQVREMHALLTQGILPAFAAG